MQFSPPAPAAPPAPRDPPPAPPVLPAPVLPPGPMPAVAASPGPRPPVAAAPASSRPAIAPASTRGGRPEAEASRSAAASRGPPASVLPLSEAPGLPSTATPPGPSAAAAPLPPSPVGLPGSPIWVVGSIRRNVGWAGHAEQMNAAASTTRRAPAAKLQTLARTAILVVICSRARNTIRDRPVRPGASCDARAGREDEHSSGL
jgi:hypothetical protein